MAATKLTIQVPTVTRQREDGGRGRMVADRRHRRGERDRQAGVQQMTEDDGGELRRVDAAAVASPQQDRRRRRQRRDEPPREQDESLGADARERGHRVLQLDLERAALPIARHDADGDKRQQKRRRQLARAEGRRPDADERRKGLADADGGAVQPAGFRVGADGADERDADERTHHQQQHPPGARRHQLAPLLAEQHVRTA